MSYRFTQPALLPSMHGRQERIQETPYTRKASGHPIDSCNATSRFIWIKMIMWADHQAMLLVLLLLLLVGKNGVHSFLNNPSRTNSLFLSFLVKVDGYNEAFRRIDECSVSGTPSEDLYDAVRLIDKNALKIYPTIEDKQELWDKAHGSWKLQLATGGGKSNTFKPIPIFAFAMIDEANFGNGVGWNEDLIFLSLLGPHFFQTKRRQMMITIDDMFLKQFLEKGTKRVTESLPDFIKNGMGLGKRPEDFVDTGTRPPAFTFIGASDKSLIARGGTGGIAIWTRLEKDIRPAAYTSLS